MSMTESQKRAQKKWRDKNKERIKTKNKEAFRRWYEKNREEHNKRALLSYYKRKTEEEVILI